MSEQRQTVSELIRNYQKLTNNLMLERSALLNRYRKDKRNIAAECGYPQYPVQFNEYYEQFTSNGVAHRVVTVMPDEAWMLWPELFETENKKLTSFERGWRDLTERLSIYSYLNRVDSMSGIGSYGALFLGFADGKGLDQPAGQVDRYGNITPYPDGNELLYLRCFDESGAMIESLERDDNSPRKGLPEFYKIKFADPANSGATITSVKSDEKKVHWTRVIHVADNRLSSEVWGLPRQKPVWNWELDVYKIMGAAGEGYWRNASPTYSVETMPELATQGITVDMEYDTIVQEFDKLNRRLQNFMAFENLTVKSLAPQAVSPADHLAALLQLITLSIKVPMRYFLGSEVGKLASTQDKGSWNGRIMHRNKDHTSPYVLRPVADRLIAVGALSRPRKARYQDYWPDLNTPTDKDRADIALKKSTALMNYLIGRISLIMSPERFFVWCLGMTQEEAEVAIASAKDSPKLPDPNMTPNDKAQGGKATPAGGPTNK